MNADALLRSRYRVLASVGKGGQGELFRVEDTHIEGKVWVAKQLAAVGVLDQHPEVAALRLGLPGLPRISEAFSENGSFWIIRDYVEGRGLDDLRTEQGGSFTPEVLAELAAAIASILEQLHAAGYVLIDVKPANFVRTADGRLLLVDPGSIVPRGLRNPAASGTPGFSAPEAHTGGALTPAADVFGLAATLVWLQSMKTPVPDTDLGDGLNMGPLGQPALQGLRSALQANPELRPTIASLIDALQAPTGTKCPACGYLGGGSGKFCPKCGTPLTGPSIVVPRPPAPVPARRMLLPTEIERRPTLAAAIERRASSAGPVSPETAALWRQAERLAVVDGFDRLIALDRASIDSFKHQETAALRLLREFRGSGVLADEVGLGKTIEAGIVLNELLARDLAGRVLILTPPHLTSKWALELATKFHDASFVVCSGPDNWGRPRLIASYRQSVLRWFERSHASFGTDWRRITTGSNPYLCVCACGCRRNSGGAYEKCDRCESDTRSLRSNLPEYDVVIVDEAHHLYRTDGALTSLGQLVSQLRRRYLLLLTATPVRRDTRELYQLISLVRPGEFKNLDDFEARVARPLMATSSRQAAVGQLQGVLNRVMVRQRRRDIQIDWPKKTPYRHAVSLSPEERSIRDRALDLGRAQTGQRARTIVAAANSSPFAAAAALGEQLQMAAGDPAKTARLLAILASEPNERFVVFAESQPTLTSLDLAVQSTGRPSLLYSGDRAKKLQIVRRFRSTPGSVLIADKSLAEGSDLQFAHLLVVYDIPWNPFALEQMIGRLYRIGQTSPVQIHAIVSADGLDHELFELYDKALRMFDRQVGELDAILGQLDDDFDFASEVWNAVSTSRTTAEIHEKFASLHNAIDRALKELLDEEEFLRGMGLA